MSAAPRSRLAFAVEFLMAIPIEGSDRMQVTLRTASDAPLTLRLTRPEAAELVRMIREERNRGSRTAEAPART